MNNVAKSDANPELAREVEEHRSAVGEVLDRIEQIAPALEAEAAPSEQLGKLTDKAVALIFASGMAKGFLPKELGGLGLYPGEALPIMKRVAYIDGSIGWVNTIFVSGGLMVNYLPTDVSDELLDGNGEICFGAVSNGSGTAELTEQGWKISGSYRYASGIKHAKYVFTPAMKIVDGQPVAPPAGFGIFIIPTSEIEDHGGWDVLGLRATGSVDFSIKDVLIPTRFECQAFGAPTRGGRAAAGGMQLLIPIMHLGFAMGITERILDEMKPIASKKPPLPGAQAMGEKDGFRIEYARKYTEAAAARAIVEQVMAGIDDTLRRGETLTTRQQSMLRAVNIHAHEVTREVANWAFLRAGGAALRQGTLQRAIRDALAGCQHFIASDAHYANIGHDLLGAPDNYGWLDLHRFGPLPEKAAA